MICPNCGHTSSFTECLATSIERHGLDMPPYEHFTDTWLECDRCGARTDWEELKRLALSDYRQFTGRESNR